jgi:DNA primase
MPGIDYATLRARITMEEVLELVSFRPLKRKGCRVRGRCPFGCGNSPRDFVANLAVRRYRCFGCGRHGSQLDLWASIQGQPLHPAALDLCQQLSIDPPRIHRW